MTIDWVAQIEGDGEVGKIKIGIEVVDVECGKGCGKGFDLVADNGDDVSQGGFDSRDNAMYAIGKIWEYEGWNLEWL